jgi:ELWxxDGT repeat protein
VRVRDIFVGPSGSDPYDFAAVGSTLFFAAQQSAGNVELWKSDGSEAGTVLVKEIHPAGGSFPSELRALGSQVIFIADDGTTGVELWKSNGTAGTVLIEEIVPGPGGISSTTTPRIAVLGGRCSQHRRPRRPARRHHARRALTCRASAMEVFPVRRLGAPSPSTATSSPNDREIWRSDGTRRD